jgi:hypothetical protein
MNIKFSSLRGSALVFLLCGAWLRAAVIFDNLNTPNGSFTVDASNWDGQSFQVGGDNYTLTSVVLRMGTASDQSGNFFVRIYAANGTGLTPGSFLAALNGSANPSAPGDYTYTPAETVNLAANTFYYVVAGVSSGSGSYDWRAESGGGVAVGNTIGNSSSTDAGESWQARSSIVTSSMQVNGDVNPIPEPVNVALMVFGVLLIAACSFRLRRDRPARPPNLVRSWPCSFRRSESRPAR